MQVKLPGWAANGEWTVDQGSKGRHPAWYHFLKHNSPLDIFNLLTKSDSQSCQIGGLLLYLFTYLSPPLDGEYLEAGVLSWAALDLQAWPRA